MIYNSEIKAEARQLFVEKELSATAVSKYFGGKPSVQCVLNWALKKDKHGKSWYDYRDERAEQKMLQMSPTNMANKVLEKLWSMLNDPNIETAKLPDALWKALKGMERLTGPELQIPVMYHMLQDLILFGKKTQPQLITEEFLELLRAYKNHIKGRLENDYS